MTREDLLSQPRALAMLVPTPAPRSYKVPVDVQAALDNFRDFFVAQVQEANLDYMVSHTVACGPDDSQIYGMLIYVMCADKSQLACKILIYGVVTKVGLEGIVVKFITSTGNYVFDRKILLSSARTGIIDEMVSELAELINRTR
jgi:hypothetical protein